MAALLYEALLAAALLLGASTAFYAAFPGVWSGPLRHLFQAFLTAVLGCYFVWCWCHSGQTLPMKTWKLRLEGGDGKSVPTALALVRFALATLAYGATLAGCAVLWIWPQFALGWALLAPGMITLAWALIDRERQFLHDRLAGTRIVLTDDAGARD